MSTRADRLHDALSKTFEGLFTVVEEASFERREGHARLLYPSLPFRLFNGVLVESETCSGVAESIREVEERGLPCGVQVRAGANPDVEVEAARLGLSARTPMPGMAATPDELADARAHRLEIGRVDDEQGLAEAARVAAAGFGLPAKALQPLYTPGLLGLPGFSVYLGRSDGHAVTTAIGYRTDEEVAIFSVGTSPEHRRRGYAGAVTVHAARAGFENGADLAWLQTSEMAESLYLALGFRHVEMHHLLRRPEEGT